MRWILLIILAVFFGGFGILKTKDFPSYKFLITFSLMFFTSSLALNFSPIADKFIQSLPEGERIPVSYFIFTCGFVAWGLAFMFFGELLKKIIREVFVQRKSLK